MKFQVTIQDIFECDLERAFKTPMLCDVTQVHTGMGVMPKIVGTSDDANWGKVGSSKKVYAAASALNKGGYVSRDHVLEREENVRWKIRVDDFQAWMLGFYQFEGTWETEFISENQTKVIYTYELFSRSLMFYPLAWMFAKIFWKRYMQQVLSNVKGMCAREEVYLFE